MNTGHVCSRTQYYKYNAAVAVLDHACRNGFTKSQNVHSHLTKNNIGIYSQNVSSARAAFDALCERYKGVTGKKCRSDFNALFEHILILSEPVYTKLLEQYGQEKVNKSLMVRAKKYASDIQAEFGFTPFAIDAHFDEGKIDHETGQVILNPHFHIQFFNYDFDKRIAPLRHIMKKGLDSNGKTHQLNPNFVLMQDIAAKHFSGLGFKRGESKLATGRQHEQKENFIRNKLKAVQQKETILKQQCVSLNYELQKQRINHTKLSLEIETKKQEALSWGQEVVKLKQQTLKLTELIKKRAISAVRQLVNKNPVKSGPSQRAQ